MGRAMQSPGMEKVKCNVCGHIVFDQGVIKSRVVQIGHDASEAKCKMCKTMVAVPVVYKPLNS